MWRERLTQQLQIDSRWQSVLERDPTADGKFVYAVHSTGIYCRASCPSRRPSRDRVEFFDSPEEADRAGYRACLRCKPRDAGAPTAAAVVSACRIIESRSDEPLDLSMLATEVGLSPQHLQRTFKRAVGVTPREYADACRLTRFKEGLQGGESVTEAMVNAGYGSASRLYERAQSQLGMKPAEYKKGSAEMDIVYTIVDSPLGRLLVGGTDKGICAVTLGDDDQALELALRQEYPAASLRHAQGELSEAVELILRHLNGSLPDLRLPLDVRATAFQRQVWQELQAIPYGATRTYSQVAESIGRPNAVRAVASACASNPVSLVVPCHRVVRGTGALAGYRWGIERKKKLLEKERTAIVGHGKSEVKAEVTTQLTGRDPT